ncbi:16S rRNA (guanine(527)-N(7))-methyltransferase RsmG [Yoonia sp. 208BN28-4]|uniref:16S rRNA (guanine(527)-N(7))-methyltransferase RsmG n=1 Tax=Yoonia sp. 208BN28-4 TaxID=3126505 RepID=UPI0030A5DD06
MKNLPDIGVNVSRETLDTLTHFADLTVKWTNKINLIAPSTISDVWNRHIVDSAQMYQLAPNSYATWADLGSGGGFPGVVSAILAKQHHPAAKFVLIESDQRKATFLRTAARELALNMSVYPQRIEETDCQSADVVSARALMSLSELLPHLQTHLSNDGIALLHKGRRYAEEIRDARKDWDFELAQYPSITDADARILTLKRIARA